MPDIRLDANHDIDPTGDLLVSGVAAIAQNLLIVFRTVRGELLSADSRGLPIYEMMGKGLDDRAIEQILRAEALRVDGVLAVETVEVSRSSQTRTLSGTMTVTTSDGQTTVSI